MPLRDGLEELMLHRSNAGTAWLWKYSNQSLNGK